MNVRGTPYRTVWLEGRTVRLIDQRVLPHAFEILGCPTFRETAQAIQTMAVRGAGAIGAAAGYAVAQAALEAADGALVPFVQHAAQVIRATRPTAHDLFYAVEQVQRAVEGAPTAEAARAAAVARAGRLADENAAAGEAIGRIGAPLLREGMRVLTHCNAGWLAFADWGSALAPIYCAHRTGMRLFVYVAETRPRSQGAKLTAWELSQEGVPHVIVADTAVGSRFQRGEIDAVIVGADRIAANGDVVNKIGTYTVALLARHHGVPFYVAAPRSTFDATLADGSLIPIEERDPEEVLYVTGLSDCGTVERVRVADAASSAQNPAFDLTPASLVTRLITEEGLLEPTTKAIGRWLHRPAVQRTRPRASAPTDTPATRPQAR